MKTPDVLLPALRQYQHNDCSGLISGFEHKETCKIVTGLQAKLRELEAKLRELYGYLLQADKDGESNIPQELGNEIEELLR